MSTTSVRPPRFFVAEGTEALERNLEHLAGSPAEQLDSLGAAVYEGLRTYDGTCFFGLLEHLARLGASCAALGLERSYEPDDLHRALVQAGARFRIEEGVEARIRIDVCRAPLRQLDARSSVILTLSPFPGVPREVRQRGVAVASTSAIRRDAPEVKDSPWTVVRERHTRAEPRLAQCYEPILVDDAGRILEGVQSNLVFVRDGRPWTAPQRVLRGVTRDTVLELSPEEPAREFVTLRDLPRYDEAFLTSSVRGVVPIVQIDDVTIGAGVPGPVTRELSDRYDAHVERSLR